MKSNSEHIKPENNCTLISDPLSNPSKSEGSGIQTPSSQEIMHDLCIAITQNDYFAIEILLKTQDLDLEISIPPANRRPVHFAASSDSALAMGMLLRHKPPPDLRISDSTGMTPPFSAIQQINYELFKAILTADPGIDFNHVDKKGNTALHILCASSFHSPDKSVDFFCILSYLLKRTQVSVNALNEAGYSILMVLAAKHDFCGDVSRAAKCAQEWSGEELLADQVNKRGISAMYLLCTRDGHPKEVLEFLEFLMDFPDFDINKPIFRSNTALMLAVRHRKFRLAEFLLNQPGVNTLLVDANGKTALDHCDARDFPSRRVYTNVYRLTCTQALEATSASELPQTLVNLIVEFDMAICSFDDWDMYQCVYVGNSHCSKNCLACGVKGYRITGIIG